MPLGDPGKDSLRGVITKFRNRHILAIVQPLFLFRAEVVGSDAFQDRGGIDNSAQKHFLQHLLNCDKVRRRSTYNPEDIPLGDAIAKAIDPEGTIENGVKPTGGDEIMPQSGHLILLPYDISGADKNIPITSQLKMTSATGLLLLNAIDEAITVATNLESANRTKFITATDSMRIYGIFQQIYTWLLEFGGDENRVDVANPLATSLALGPDNAPNRITETTGLNGATK